MRDSKNSIFNLGASKSPAPSINPRYTFHYSQPEDYKFSHDSVFLAQSVWREIDTFWSEKFQILDLCSGCGVVGLELLFHAQHVNAPLARVDFMEIQALYQPHFEANVAQIPGAREVCQFLNLNYSALLGEEFLSRYDLVVCNPPYFRLGQGSQSPSEFKNRCRFFIDSDFKTLILGIANCLKPQGQAYVLLRDLSDHGFSPLSEAESWLKPNLKIEVVEQIRGTDLVRIMNCVDGL